MALRYSQKTLFFKDFQKLGHISRQFSSQRNQILKGNVSSILSVPSHITRPPYVSDPSNESIYELDKSPELVRTPGEIEGMRKAGKLGRQVMELAKKLVKPGITTDEIDKKLHEAIIEGGAYPSPLIYRNFPKSICTSINEVVCHGIPDDRVLQPTDIVNVDITVYLGGYHGDLSETFCVSDSVDKSAKLLVDTTRDALKLAISIVKPGTPFSKIGAVIEKFSEERGFGVCWEFGGHGIGRKFHNTPLIIHCKNDQPGVMKSGMTFTIEPILMESKRYKLKLWEDGWTASTVDGSWSAQFEQTVMVTDTGVEILTKL